MATYDEMIKYIEENGDTYLYDESVWIPITNELVGDTRDWMSIGNAAIFFK